MLVVAWDALYDAIPRLQAKEHLAAYSIAVLSSPYLTDDGQTTRDGILDGWRELLAQGKKMLAGMVPSSRNFSGENTPAGARRDDKWFPPLRKVQEQLAEIIGRGMRD
jgi:hypothetical protein